MSSSHSRAFEENERLLSVMSQRTLDLSINHCCDVLSTMLCIPEDHFAVDTLRIEQKGTLTSWEIPRLGRMIELSSNLKTLDLHFLFGDGTYYLFESLANLVELSELSLADEHRKWMQQHDLADLLVGAKGGRHGPLMRHLQNPQCQFKKLRLCNMGLNDHHLISILQMIPTSHIEDFDFSYNRIRLSGLLEFAHSLPRMHSLKHVGCQWNNVPWDSPLKDDDRTKLFAVLLQSMTVNTSIESMHGLGSILHRQALPVWHYVALNRAGRRILASTKPIPDGLWPQLLERAGQWSTYKNVYCANHDKAHQAKWYYQYASVNSIHLFLQYFPNMLLYSLCERYRRDVC